MEVEINLQYWNKLNMHLVRYRPTFVTDSTFGITFQRSFKMMLHKAQHFKLIYQSIIDLYLSTTLHRCRLFEHNLAPMPFILAQPCTDAVYLNTKLHWCRLFEQTLHWCRLFEHNLALMPFIWAQSCTDAVYLSTTLHWCRLFEHNLALMPFCDHAAKRLSLFGNIIISVMIS